VCLSEGRKLGLDPAELATRLDESEDRRAAEVGKHRHVAVAGPLGLSTPLPDARRFLEPSPRQHMIASSGRDQALHAREAGDLGRRRTRGWAADELLS
jgi:hypothetical protein